MKNLLDNLFSPQNEFFQMAKGAKRLTHISLSSFVLPVVFIIIAGLLTNFLFAPLLRDSFKELGAWVGEVFGLFFVFGTLIVIIFLWVRFFEGRSVSSLGFPIKGALKNYLFGFGLGVLINSIVVGLMALLGTIEIAEESTNLTGIDASGIVLLFLLGFLIQGAGEEILTRGWMTQVIGVRHVPWLGVLISTIVFTAMHLGNSGINAASVFNLLLFAIMMALLVMRDGNLWSACAWHSAWNWTLGNFYGLSVSGTGEKTTIFDLNTMGNELISGGGFGPEGSLVTTVVLFLTIIWLANDILKRANNKESNITV